ncbi:MAG: peptidyl-alpha-hydroxyglycine alpha-amidating lyase family protein [Azospirillaceae bacterium]
MGETLTMILDDTAYRLEPGWGRPADGRYGLLSQVAVDAGGRVLVLQRNDPGILVMSADGEQAALWGADRLVDPHGITALPDGRIAVVDRDAHQILFFDAEGRVAATLGERHRPRFGQPFNHPTAIAMAPDGEIYVADGYANTRVHRFSATGEHLSSWGEPGRGPGQFSTPHAVLVDARDRIVVADRENDRLQFFDRAGTLLAEWGDVYRPMALAADAMGRILVTDQVPRLSLFDLDGRLVGRCRPALNGAHGMAVAPDGIVYLAEMIPSRVTRMVPAGAAA